MRALFSLWMKTKKKNKNKNEHDQNEIGWLCTYQCFPRDGDSLEIRQPKQTLPRKFYRRLWHRGGTLDV